MLCRVISVRRDLSLAVIFSRAQVEATDKPKRPLSAYFLFTGEMRPKVCVCMYISYCFGRRVVEAWGRGGGGLVRRCRASISVLSGPVSSVIGCLFLGVFSYICHVSTHPSRNFCVYV